MSSIPPTHGHHATPPERAALVYGRAVRTALGNNATAYGFSISITAAYGLLSGPQSTVSAVETIVFALGAAVAFTLIGAVFMGLVAGGLDVIVARTVAQRSSFGRSQ